MSRAALRYAKAALSLATDKNLADTVNADMKHISTTIDSNTELDAMLQSPIVKASDKKAVLTSVFPSINALSANVIDVLITNKRIALLGSVAEKYSQLYDTLKDAQVAKVTTAVPLTKDLETKVLAKVKALTGKTTTLKNTVDETILGGFILRVGDLQYDASIANKLNTLKREFILN